MADEVAGYKCTVARKQDCPGNGPDPPPAYPRIFLRSNIKGAPLCRPGSHAGASICSWPLVNPWRAQRDIRVCTVLERAPFPKVTFEQNPTGHLLPICTHTTPNHAETRPTTRHHRASSNWRTSRAFSRHRLRDQRVAVLWPSRAHNPKVAGSNPAVQRSRHRKGRSHSRISA